MVKQLKSLASEYAKTPDGKWLNDFDWKKVPVRMDDMIGSVVGCYFFGTITLKESPDAGLIFDIYIHELRHVWQSKKQPLRYLAGKLFRRLIEDDADTEEAKAAQWYREEKC